jgi:hypothetical protein
MAGPKKSIRKAYSIDLVIAAHTGLLHYRAGASARRGLVNITVMIASTTKPVAT